MSYNKCNSCKNDKNCKIKEKNTIYYQCDSYKEKKNGKESEN